MFSNRVIIGTSCFNVNIFFVLCFQLFSFFQMPLCRDVNTQSVFMFSKYYTFVSWCFQLFIFYLAANTVCMFVLSKYCIYVANTICVFNVFSFSSPPLCHDANTIAGQQDSGLRHNHRLITNATKLSFSFVSKHQNYRKYSYC